MNIGTKTYYAAYGMNLCDRCMQPIPKEAFPHDPYPQKASVIKDYKLVFRAGLATIEPCKGSEVPCGVWAITEDKEKYLDIREGYPELYRKEYVVIDVAGYGTVRAMVYVMNGNREMRAPDNGYAGIIREGYDDWHLDKSILEKAIAEAEEAEK